MACQPGGEQLTFEELNRWLLAMDERPVPRSTFLQAAQPEATVGHVVDADGVYACFVEEETQLDPARSKVWRIATRHHGFDGCLRSPEQRRVLFENRRNARIARTQGARRCYLRLLGRWSDAWWRCKRRVRRSITPFAYGIAEGNGETAYHWPLSQQELIRKQNRAFLQVRAAVCTVVGLGIDPPKSFLACHASGRSSSNVRLLLPATAVGCLCPFAAPVRVCIHAGTIHHRESERSGR